MAFRSLTKRPQRVAQCLPADWGDGWDNVFFNVTCENQKRAGKRMELNFVDGLGLPIPEDQLYALHYCEYCETCSIKLICNGCSDCGRCKK